jgi:hypothetical protein
MDGIIWFQEGEGFKFTPNIVFFQSTDQLNEQNEEMPLQEVFSESTSSFDS